jgi:hypothetical protein
VLTHRWVTLVLLAVLVSLETTTAGEGSADAAATSYTIRTSGGSVARIGAFRIRRDPTIGAAARVFGQPSSRKLASGNSCLVDWRRLRLRIDFVNLGGYLPGQTTCTSSVGRAQSFTVRGRRFRTWEGLRVGHRSESILDRHPSAEFRHRTWWLRTAVSPFGDQSEYPVVDALVSGGRVRILRGWIGAAGE